MYVCGTYLVMLVSSPGVSGSSATRSLFGGTSSLSSLKSKNLPGTFGLGVAAAYVKNVGFFTSFSLQSGLQPG